MKISPDIAISIIKSGVPFDDKDEEFTNNKIAAIHQLTGMSEDSIRAGMQPDAADGVRNEYNEALNIAADRLLKLNPELGGIEGFKIDEAVELKKYLSAPGIRGNLDIESFETLVDKHMKGKSLKDAMPEMEALLREMNGNLSDEQIEKIISDYGNMSLNRAVPLHKKFMAALSSPLITDIPDAVPVWSDVINSFRDNKDMNKVFGDPELEGLSDEPVQSTAEPSLEDELNGATTFAEPPEVPQVEVQKKGEADALETLEVDSPSDVAEGVQQSLASERNVKEQQRLAKEQADLARQAQQEHGGPGNIIGATAGAVAGAVAGIAIAAGKVGSAAMHMASDTQWSSRLVNDLNNQVNELDKSRMAMDNHWSGFTQDAGAYADDNGLAANEVYNKMMDSDLTADDSNLRALKTQYDGLMKNKKAAAAYEDYSTNIHIVEDYGKQLAQSASKLDGKDAHEVLTSLDNATDSISNTMKLNHPVKNEEGNPESTNKRMKDLSESIQKFIEAIKNMFSMGKKEETLGMG